jgi:hypothetical protein
LGGRGFFGNGGGEDSERGRESNWEVGDGEYMHILILSDALMAGAKLAGIL